MTAQQHGQHRLVEEDGTVNFFGVRGRHSDNKGWWLVSIGAHDEMLAIRPTSVIGYVLSNLCEAAKRGNSGKVARLQLTPHHALTFYLEGYLTVEQLGRATIGDGFIDVPHVEVAGRDITVRICDRSQPNLVVTDDKGNRL